MLKIRLSRQGRKNDPKYRIVVIEAKKPRDSRYIDKLGFYDPTKEPAELKFDKVKIDHWRSRGAAFSKGLYRLIGHRLEETKK